MIREELFSFGTRRRKAPTVIELRERARELGITGFMRMKKTELKKAVDDRENEQLHEECEKLRQEYKAKQEALNKTPEAEQTAKTESEAETSSAEQNYSTEDSNSETCEDKQQIEQAEPVHFVVGKTYKNDGITCYVNLYTVTGKSEKFLYFMSYFMHRPYRKKIRLGTDKNGVFCEYVDDKEKGSPYPAQIVYATAIDDNIENPQQKHAEEETNAPVLQQETQLEIKALPEHAAHQDEKRNFVQEIANSDSQSETFDLLSQMTDKELADFMHDEFIELHGRKTSTKSKCSDIAAVIHHRFFLIANGKEVFLNNASTLGIPIALHTPLITARRELMIPEGQEKLKPVTNDWRVPTEELFAIADDNLRSVFRCDTEDEMRNLLNTADSLRTLLFMSDRIKCHIRPDVDNRKECIDIIIAKILEIKAKKALKEQQKKQQESSTEENKKAEKENHDDSENACIPAVNDMQRRKILHEMATPQEIYQYAKEHAADVDKFLEGSKIIENLVRSGKITFSPFYADRETLKGMAAELAISKDWDFECANDDTIREAVIKKTAEIFRHIEGDSGIAPKVLNNDNCNGTGEYALQENIKLGSVK